MAGGGQRAGGEEQKKDRRLRWGNMSRQGGASWEMESLGKMGSCSTEAAFAQESIDPLQDASVLCLFQLWASLSL